MHQFIFNRHLSMLNWNQDKLASNFHQNFRFYQSDRLRISVLKLYISPLITISKIRKGLAIIGNEDLTIALFQFGQSFCLHKMHCQYFKNKYLFFLSREFNSHETCWTDCSGD